MSDVEFLGPVVSNDGLALLSRLGALQAYIARLLTEAADPLRVRALLSRDYIVASPILEILFTQFHAPLDLDLLHTSVFSLALHVVSWDKQACESVVVLDRVIAHWSFRLPTIR